MSIQLWLRDSEMFMRIHSIRCNWLYGYQSVSIALILWTQMAEWIAEMSFYGLESCWERPCLHNNPFICTFVSNPHTYKHTWCLQAQVYSPGWMKKTINKGSNIKKNAHMRSSLVLCKHNSHNVMETKSVSTLHGPFTRHIAQGAKHRSDFKGVEHHSGQM